MSIRARDSSRDGPRCSGGAVVVLVSGGCRRQIVRYQNGPPENATTTIIIILASSSRNITLSQALDAIRQPARSLQETLVSPKPGSYPMATPCSYVRFSTDRSLCLKPWSLARLTSLAALLPLNPGRSFPSVPSSLCWPCPSLCRSCLVPCCALSRRCCLLSSALLSSPAASSSSISPPPSPSSPSWLVLLLLASLLCPVSPIRQIPRVVLRRKRNDPKPTAQKGHGAAHIQELLLLTITARLLLCIKLRTSDILLPLSQLSPDSALLQFRTGCL